MAATIYGPFTDSFVAYLDGTGAAHTQFVSQSTGGSPIQAPWNIIVDPDTGIRLGSANPFPIQVPAIAPQASTQAEASHVFNNALGSVGACTLLAFQVNTIEQNGWLLLFDAVAAPSDGTVRPIKWWQIGANDTLDWHGYPIALANGCVFVFSLTGPFTQSSAGSTAVFSAEVR